MQHSLPPVAERFLRYVQIDTQSDPSSDSVPSTDKQKILGELLVEELRDINAQDVLIDEYGYVFATLPAVPSNNALSSLTLGLLAHMDTSPDESGKDVKPIIHENYSGSVITLPGDPSISLDPEKRPALLDHLGHDIITSDGTTLLGSDDKAGVAILMQLAEDLIHNSTSPRPKIRLCFTIDEEIGRGVDHLDIEKLGADVAYTIDGSGIDTIFSETFNAVQAKLHIEGIMVHPGYAKGIMVNAVRILSEFIASLPENAAPESTSDREGYIHPHKVTTGDASLAEAIIILRDFYQEGIESKKNYLTSLVHFLQLKHPDAQISLTFEDQYQNMKTYIEQKDLRVIELAHRAAKNIGYQLHEEVIRGGTDGARLSELGVPTPNIFNGGHDYHSKFEWNTVQNLERSLKYLKSLVSEWGLEIH